MNRKVVLSVAFAAFANLHFVPAAQAQTADIHAVRCNACSEEQYEQAAIGQGLGTRYVYDFAHSYLLSYQVGREPNGHGGYLYEAVGLPVAPVYTSLFNDADFVYKHGGTLSKSMALGLPGAPGTEGHADTSVFSLFNSNEGMNLFGNWLGSYLGSHVPVTAPTGAAELQSLMASNPTIDFVGDDKRLIVEVTFTDGIAEFELSASEKRYKYIPGSAQDSDGHSIPENASQINHFNYNFPGGVNSSSYRGFLSLINFWNIPVGVAGWKCGTATGGDGSSSQTCVMMR